MELSSLTPGQLLVDRELTISAEVAAAYREAVEDTTSLYQDHQVVPSMAVAALALAMVMEAVQLPSGAVHMGQTLEFAGPVVPQGPLQCSAHVAQNSVRGTTRFLGLEFRAARQGQTVVSGRADILVREEVPA